ncbi:type II secretion system protein GspG [bacterium]|nr:type II secretion system protein GspG [bacterium]
MYPQNRKTLELYYDALHDYARDVGQFPETLMDLTRPPAGRAGWKGPYLPSLPNDAWSRPFVYERMETGPYPYRLASTGANGQPWDEDDYPIDDVRRNRMERDLKAYTLAVVLFRTHVGRYPTTEEGLRSLFVQPQGAGGWRGPYAPKVLRDPWNRDFHYSLELREGEPYFDVWTQGPDAAASTDDIHIRDIPGTEQFFIPEGEIERELARLRGQQPHDQSE